MNIRIIKRDEPTEGIVSRLFNAANKGIFDGQYITPYLESCRWYIERIDAQVVMTRDVGYHTSGWWKIRITKDATTCQSTTPAVIT